jgi:hypothetical protein
MRRAQTQSHNEDALGARTINGQPEYAVLEEVRLILQRRGVGYVEAAGGTLHIQYGSAEARIGFRRAADATIVTVSSVVLDHVQVEGDTELRLLRSLNDRNRRLPFGKFFLDLESGELVIEYEILGDELDEPELMTALVAVASLADDHDDLIQEEFETGRRAAERHGWDEVSRPF